MPITREQALDLFRSDDLIGLGMEADALRRSLHPERVVTYTIDRRIDCSAFRRHGSADEALGAIQSSIAEMLELGGTGVWMQGGADPEVSLEWFEGLLRATRERFPTIWLEALSAPEILLLARRAGIPLHDAILRLRDVGLQSIAGDGELDEGWFAVHRTAHMLGISTTAAISASEAIEERVEWLEQIRRLQDETGGFAAFLPWAGAPRNSVQDEATAVDSMKALAIARLYLANIKNMQLSLATQGLKVVQMGLRFGGNDAGSVPSGENGAAIAKYATEEDLRRIIRDAGFRPVQRDALYTTLFLN
jgi:cyclic dehypoxanthinyl futalosine synthase